MSLTKLEPSQLPVPGQMFLVTGWCASSSTPNSVSRGSESPLFVSDGPSSSPDRARPWIGVVCSKDMLDSNMLFTKPAYGADVRDLTIVDDDPCRGIPHKQRQWAVYLPEKDMYRWVHKRQLHRLSESDMEQLDGDADDETTRLKTLYEAIMMLLPENREEKIEFWTMQMQQKMGSDERRDMPGAQGSNGVGMQAISEGGVHNEKRRSAKKHNFRPNPLHDDEDSDGDLPEDSKSKSRRSGRLRHRSMPSGRRFDTDMSGRGMFDDDALEIPEPKRRRKLDENSSPRAAGSSTMGKIVSEVSKDWRTKRTMVSRNAEPHSGGQDTDDEDSDSSNDCASASESSESEDELEKLLNIEAGERILSERQNGGLNGKPLNKKGKKMSDKQRRSRPRDIHWFSCQTLVQPLPPAQLLKVLTSRRTRAEDANKVTFVDGTTITKPSYYIENHRSQGGTGHPHNIVDVHVGQRNTVIPVIKNDIVSKAPMIADLMQSPQNRNPYIMNPVFIAIEPEVFGWVADWLSTGDYEPRLTVVDDTARPVQEKWREENDERTGDDHSMTVINEDQTIEPIEDPSRGIQMISYDVMKWTPSGKERSLRSSAHLYQFADNFNLADLKSLVMMKVYALGRLYEEGISASTILAMARISFLPKFEIATVPSVSTHEGQIPVKSMRLTPAPSPPGADARYQSHTPKYETSKNKSLDMKEWLIEMLARNFRDFTRNMSDEFFEVVDGVQGLEKRILERRGEILKEESGKDKIGYGEAKK